MKALENLFARSRTHVYVYIYIGSIGIQRTVLNSLIAAIIGLASCLAIVYRTPDLIVYTALLILTLSSLLAATQLCPTYRDICHTVRCLARG